MQHFEQEPTRPRDKSEQKVLFVDEKKMHILVKISFLLLFISPLSIQK